MEKEEPKKFSRKKEDFKCEVCGLIVQGTGYTDHCPSCLWSKHVDINPGDRASKCKGLMRPSKTEHNRSSFFIYYVCEKCRMGKRVVSAPDDKEEMLFMLLGANLHS